MSVKIDPDVRQMDIFQLRAEVMRLRTAFRKELEHTGNHRCWITLMETVDGRQIQPLTLPKEEFLHNCARYYDRNQKK